MMTKHLHLAPVRLAVVGTGQIGRQSHIPAALACAEVELAALVDPVAERAHEVARAFGIRPAVATDVAHVLDRIDGAIIATPNHTHASIARACLAAGKSVLVEKPLAHTCADAEAIVVAAREARAVLAVGYCSRFRDNVLLLKELLDAGAFGRVIRFVHQAGTAGGWAPLSGYNLDRASTGGGVLVVTGSHFVDRLLYFWGRPDRVEFTDDSEGGPEANCRAVFQWASGLEGYAIYSKTVSLPSLLAIETDRGRVVVQDNDEAEIVFRPNGNSALEQIFRRRGSRGAQEDVFALQIKDFARAHRDRRQPLVDGEQGLASMRLIDRLYACRRPMRADWYESPNDIAAVPASAAGAVVAGAPR